MRLHRVRLPIKEWYMQFNIHLQVNCFIHQMGGVGHLVKNKFLILCKDGVHTN